MHEQGMTAGTHRTPWQVTRGVWYALFMREAISRTMKDRFGWFWMLFEPIAHVILMVVIRTFFVKTKIVLGADFVSWLITGLLGFFLFREAMMRPMNAISVNQRIFTYRQIHPIDPVLVRCFLEGALKTLVFLIFIACGALVGLDIVPHDPLAVMGIWLGLWVLGTGAGLIVSTGDTLFPEIGHIVRISTLPLLIVSGVLFPLNFAPENILGYLLLNPVVHGLEALRGAFFPLYHPVPGTSLIYLWLFALSLVTIGLMLHIRYAARLKAS